VLEKVKKNIEIHDKNAQRREIGSLRLKDNQGSFLKVASFQTRIEVEGSTSDLKYEESQESDLPVEQLPEPQVVF